MSKLDKKPKGKDNKVNKQKNIEVEELKAQLARALADYDNLQKRVAKEQENLERVLKIRVITKFLQVFDMLNEVQNNLNDSGLAIAMNSFKDVLKEEGVIEIAAIPGTSFDEELHEAVDVVVDEEKEDGEIVNVQQIGWQFNNGTVLRYAKVIVNKKGDN